MKLSIIVPVYNEVQTLNVLFEKLSQFNPANFEKEIIVVDDGSNDGSKSFLDKLQMQYNFNLIKHLQNQGKGVAIKTALTHATGDLTMFQDADLEYDPNDCYSLLEPFSNSNVQVVYGYRTDPGYKTFYFGNKIFTFFVNLLFQSNLRDPYSCYKIIRKSLLNQMRFESKGFEFEAEITAKILRRGIKIVQLPISYHPRTFQKGKKARFFRDGLKGLSTFLKYRLKN